MILKLEPSDLENVYVDRDGELNDMGRQGFSIYLEKEVEIHFKDENDAVHLARLILDRMGISHN